MKSVVGIDPGGTPYGKVGAVRLSPSGETKFFPWSDPFDVLGWSQFLTEAGPCVAVVEHVTTTPQMGVVSAGNFIANYRSWGLALRFYHIPTLRVQPEEWQQPFMPGKMTKKERKTHLHQVAKQRYGKVLKPAADGYLIATFGQLEYERFFNSTEPCHARSRARITLGF